MLNNYRYLLVDLCDAAVMCILAGVAVTVAGCGGAPAPPLTDQQKQTLAAASCAGDCDATCAPPTCAGSCSGTMTETVGEYDYTAPCGGSYTANGETYTCDCRSNLTATGTECSCEGKSTPI
jgi:hypothetical protein